MNFKETILKQQIENTLKYLVDEGFVKMVNGNEYELISEEERLKTLLDITEV
jgi:hypothetical protein